MTIQKNYYNMKRGVITSVDVDQDTSQVLVDVNVGYNRDFLGIEMKMPTTGMFYVPTPGEHVIVYDEGDGRRAAMHPQSPSDPPPLPDIKEGETAIVANESTKIIVKKDGSIVVNGDSVVLGDGGTNLLTDVTISTETDADGHVTSVSLNKTRSTVSETE